MATDVAIADANGKLIPNYQSGPNFNAYEKYAQAVKAAADQNGIGNQLRWGGYFSGPPGKYGAADMMHFDLGGKLGMKMAGGSFAHGLTAQQLAMLPGAVSSGMGTTVSPTQVASADQPPRLVTPSVTAAGGADASLSSSPLIGMDPNSQKYKDLYAKIGAQNTNSPAVKNATFLKHFPVFKQIYQADNLINKYDSPLYGGIGRQPTIPDNFGTGHSGNTAASTAPVAAQSTDFNSALASARAAYAQNPSQDTQYFSWTNPNTGKLETYYIGNYQSGGSVRGNNATANAVRLARR